MVKRDLISRGLDLMYARELLEKSLSRKGVTYAASALTNSFVGLLKSEYAMNVRARSRWVVDRFGTMGDQEPREFMTENVGKWGAEFERITALRDLELG